MGAELNEATISEVKEACRKIFHHEKAKNTPINVMGPPGVGKSELFEQLAKEWGAEYRVFLTATMDPTDIVGVPHEKDGVTYFCPPTDWIALTEDCHKVGVDPKTPMVAVLDDLPSCNPHVFNALLRPLCNGEVAGSKIRKNVLLAATGNRVEDRAGAAQIPTALANRFMHFSIRIDTNQWVDWATQNSIDPYIISFIERTGARALHSFQATAGFMAFPTPRSVAMASNVLKALGTENTNSLNLALTGCCGGGWSSEFMAFLRYKDSVIPVEEIFKNPSKVKVPAERDIDISFITVNNLIAALLDNFTVERAKAFITYICRINSEEIAIVATKKFLRAIMESDKISDENRSAVNSLEESWNLFSKYQHLLESAK